MTSVGGGIHWLKYWWRVEISNRVCFEYVLPNKFIPIRSNDTLWVTPKIKRMIIEKANQIYQLYVKHGQSIADYQIFRDITSSCKSVIKDVKSNYFSPKKYWWILHILVKFFLYVTITHC